MRATLAGPTDGPFGRSSRSSKFFMGPTLSAGRPAGFSESARSRPGHREAGRNGARRRCAVAAVGDRRLADDLPEGAAERPGAGEADVEAVAGHALVGLA